MEADRRPVGWDVALGFLGEMESSGRARLSGAYHDYGFLETTDWGNLTVSVAELNSITFDVSGAALHFTPEMCDQVLQAPWDNALCKSLSFVIGDMTFTVETSDWQHFD